MATLYNGISDSDLQALADSEVTSAQRAALMAKIHDLPQAMQRLEYLLYQKMILKEFWKNQRLE